MAATRRQHKNQKESAWVPPLQRDPGPWNRLLLRQVMKEAGFHPLPSEWWHFNRVSRQTAKERYRVIP